jgi:hypothetical protein
MVGHSGVAVRRPADGRLRDLRGCLGLAAPARGRDVRGQPAVVVPGGRARRFARSGIDRFAAPTRWSPLPTGEPLLDGGRAWLRCATRPPIEAGDHFLIVGLVLAAGTDPDAAPLIYHDRAFHVLP